MQRSEVDPMKARYGRIVAGTAILVLSASAFGYVVTQQASGGTVYYHVEVEEGDPPVRDFHLRAPRGKDLKGAPNDPSVDNDQRTGWTSSKTAAKGKKGGSVSWKTDDETSGPDSDSEDDPGAPGETITFSMAGASKANWGDVEYWVTSDGESEVPSGSAGGSLPGALACVTVTPGDTTPSASTIQALTILSTEDARPWRIYLSSSLSTPGDPATDPLDIGIDTGNPPPPVLGISVTPDQGVLNAPPPPTWANANAQLAVGNAPVGTKFYMVAAVLDELNDIWLYTEVMTFEVGPN